MSVQTKKPKVSKALKAGGNGSSGPSADGKNAPLVADIRLLGRILGEVIREQDGEPAFLLVEKIRQLSVAYRLKQDAAAGKSLDRLLKTLVIACVGERLEFKDFLVRIHERYGFVIGDAQARQFIDSGTADQEDFSDNAHRLEERLASLGLLKRLSDSCAYVENPFQRAKAA